MGEKGKPMSIQQARKMRDGVLKGDSAIAQAWKELIDSGGSLVEPESADEASEVDDRGQTPLDMKNRGSHTLAYLRRVDEQF